MPHPLLLMAPVPILETATFYWWHWPDRDLLPKRFRPFLLAKGLLKGLVAIGITVGCYRLSPAFGWSYAIAHPLVGVALHVRWCRRHGVDPIHVEPRRQYVLATASWVERLEDAEKARKGVG